MTYALKNFNSIEQLETYLDQTNTSGRNTKGNFAVIDSYGNGAMYEIANNVYYKYAINDTTDYVIRTNFSLNGLSNNGLERYARSETIIEELVESNNFGLESLIKYHFRDFSDYDAEPYPIPFLEQTDGHYGYIDNRVSICRNISIGSMYIEGINETGQIPIMWTISGFPAVTPVIPYIPRIFAQSEYSLPLKSQELRSYLMDINSYLINTLHFTKPNNQGIWDIITPFESDIIDEFYALSQSEDFLERYSIWLAQKEAEAYQLMESILVSLDETDETVPLVLNNAISTYPNPHKGKFNLEIKHTFNSDYTVDVFNIKGQLILRERFSPNKDNSLKNIKLDSKLPTGIYFVMVADEERMFITKTIKIK
jgi:hypothetical protein